MRLIIWGWCYIIESALLVIVELLFYGLVGVTIINIVLLGIICWLLHKQ